ncbi:MAG: leucyl aminopeptidase [Bacteroidetes bacterium]|jgi:leucyl aminopeptidase|nr:leucyl aminopeptidase [Bacteroidota bacterium]
MEFRILPSPEPHHALLVLSCQIGEQVVYDAPDSAGPIIAHYLNHTVFQSKPGEFAYILGPDGQRILLCGAGKLEKCSQDKLRRAIGKGIKEARKHKMTHVWVGYPSWAAGVLVIDWEQLVGETAIMANYEYKSYITDKQWVVGLTEVALASVHPMANELVRKGVILGECTVDARELINAPAHELYPEALAQKAQYWGTAFGFEVQVYDEEACRQMRMEAFLSVGQASSRLPYLIVMRWKGQGLNTPIGLVGKGVTYDTGGLSIKPTQGMLHMKGDMGGAALVIATMCALARLGSAQSVVGVVAACENAIAGNAYRPGDILKSMQGLTIEVGNTDAEGRLTLADAITYAITKENVRAVVDVATLTGAVKTALGEHVAGVVCSEDSLYTKLQQASKQADENFWRLPIDDEYRDLVSSDVADLSNIGRDGLAGTITAACFVEAFTGGLPWLHIDIAGVSFTRKDHEYISKGGSGRPMRSLYHLVEGWDREQAG